MSTIFRDPVDINAFHFNDGVAVDSALFYCDMMDGWGDTGEPRVEVSEFGYSDGVVAASRFPMNEKYIDIAGYVLVSDRAAGERAADRLSVLFGPDAELLVTRFGPISKSMDMRSASDFQISQDAGSDGFRFIMRLMAPWPFKFSPLEKVALAGVFSGGEYYRVYDHILNGRVYDTVGFGRVYFPDLANSSTVGTESRRNLVNNPSAGVNTTYYAVVAGTTGVAAVTRVAAGGPSGGSFARATWSTASTVIGSGMVYGNAGTDPGLQSVLPDDLVSGRVQIRTSIVQRMILYIQYLNAAGTPISSTSSAQLVTVANTWTPVVLDQATVAPALAAKVHLMMYSVAGTSAAVWPIGATLDVAQVQAVENATAGTYFDGNTLPYNGTPSKAYGWVGAVDASQSIETTFTDVSVLNPLADNATINNQGTADAYPVITITGPLLAGSWELINETTGEVQSFEIDLSTGVQLVIDNRDKTAYIGTQAVDYYLRGDWIRLIPGVNVVRLSTGEANPDARLQVSAHDTWKR